MVLTCGFIEQPSWQRKSEWAQSSWTSKSLRRWLALYGYFDALLSWHGRRRKVAPGHRASYLLWGSTRQQTRHQACYLAGLGWTGLGQLGRTQQSFSHRLGTCCIKSVSRMHHPAC
jgi:hypothetical protein